MFIGHHYHNLEAKGRLAIPQAFRSELKSGGVITLGLDGCLFLFPNSYWNTLSEKLASLPITNQQARHFVRLLVQQASALSLDSQGRTLIPDFLRKFAKLKKQVVVAGALTKIEIWDQTTYHTHLDSLIKDTNPWEELSQFGI